uniref:Ribosomal protein l10A n=1 Tax=Neolamarckia cadamba TaxID=153762 RepID=A0A2R3TVC9_9GENT|nr:ribosomal protein l10A [Neolamarckia cadamba]
MADMVPRERVVAAVNALLKWKEAQSAAQKPQLLPQDDFIYLNLTLKKIPQKSRTKPFRIPLPNPIFDPSSELCLIIDDRPKSNLTSETAKKIIKSQNIPVSKVLKLSKLRSNYKPFEAKRKLCDSYDLFLVDRGVVHMLPKLLGKFFFKKKKLPLPLDLSHKNWKEQIERALGCGLLYMRTGTCCVMKVGKVSMESEEIAENVVEGINGVVQVVPKKWGGVRSLHLKFSDSLALPVYQALPDVKLRIDGVKETEEVTDGDGDVEVKEESSGGEGKIGKKKKKKGRIHEVRYMDVGVGEGVDALGSEDDEDEGKKSEDGEFVGAGVEDNLDGGDEGEDDESKKSEDDDDEEEDEDFDSDAFVVKKGKKGKSVKGLAKKVGKVEKSREKEGKKSRLSSEGAKKSSEKKEKKKSKLGARSKEGSITKKTKRSKNRV